MTTTSLREVEADHLVVTTRPAAMEQGGVARLKMKSAFGRKPGQRVNEKREGGMTDEVLLPAL